MYYIKDAKFRRLTEYNGVPCAEVEVSPGAADEPDLLVYIARSDGIHGQTGQDESVSQYEIVHMIRSDADLEIDWYDNSMHDAFAVVPEDKFGDKGWPDQAEQREQFKRNLLSHADIASKLEQQLPR